MRRNDEVKWTKDEIEKLKQVVEHTITIQELSLLFNKTDSSVRYCLQKNKIEYKTKYKELQDLDKDTIISLYKEGKSMRSIGQLLNCSMGCIKNKLIKYKCSIREKNEHKKFKVDSTFFNVIDSEAKAYFLGLMYADGCISKDSNIFSICLQESDKNILESFLKVLKSDKSLYIRENKDKREGFKHCKKCYILQVSDANLHFNLIDKGCIPQKTSTLRFPTKEQIPSYLYSHFIRGFFDGDGSISNNKTDSHFSIIGTLDMVKNIQNILINDVKVKETKISMYKCKIDTVYTLQYSGRRQILKILEWLYKDATYFIERKYNKFLYLKEKMTNV